ncbi:hypothetical protein FEDK69T_18940 [Flavobacterium enshiense DK69]|uniref:methyltransferase domain-containing protein n=1 Tax=Flavobacterium enshiense TaxID=1341165 RepID=UPI0003C5AA94|nr:methyltransferase domain-containing protein [Flavobacterium enshiense]ESU22637.1 hypothetical protein FEDK69T_18940 [Flavobacterium enshiense DK69]
MKSTETEKLILSRKGDWIFDHNVSLVFDVHVRKSIPCYEEVQELIAIISSKLLPDNALVYDLGTATGEIIKNIFKANQSKNTTFVGIDHSVQMLEIARNKCSKIKNVKFVNEDIEDFNYEFSDLIVAAFTIQFTEVKNRKNILQRIKNSLKEDCYFIFCEKINFQDSKINNLYTRIHEDWKSEYFSKEEIKAKKESLKNVMTPLTLNENINLLKDAGFTEINIFFQWCNFVCILAK